MKIVTVDNGNTNPHVGIFSKGKLEKVIPLSDYVPESEDFVLVSDVGGPLNFGPSFDLKSKRSAGAFFEMPVHYSLTLGDDRLIVGYSLFSKIKGDERVLSIDAGTFMTIDLITKDGFLGGFIFPGVTTFLRSFQQGSNLPHLTYSGASETKNKMPQTTEEAILRATDTYLDAVLEKTIKDASPSKIVLTGGSLEIIKNKILKLNLPITLETDLHLIHSALFEIYQRHLHSA